MKFNPAIHHRKSIRIKGYNYAQDGAYFVTILSVGAYCNTPLHGIRNNTTRPYTAYTTTRHAPTRHTQRHDTGRIAIRPYAAYATTIIP